MSLRHNDEAWESAYEQAIEELEDELGREPTDDEIEDRAQSILDNAEPDWDAYSKDEEFDQ